MKISLKILVKSILPALASLIIFIIFSYLIALPHLKDSLLQDKINKLEDLTHSVYNLISYNYKISKEKNLNVDSLKKSTLETIRNIRYGKNNNEYFWINDVNYIMLMHPYRPDLENKNLKYFKDPKGVYLFQDFVYIATTKGEGISKYMWQYKKDSTLIENKISFVRLFKPWGWIIGTGIYLTDLSESIENFQKKLIYYSLFSSFIILLISIYIIYHNHKLELEKAQYLEELKLSEQKFRTIAEQALLGITIIQNDKITFFNEACEKMFGYDKDEIYSLSPGDFYDKLVDDEYKELIKEQVFKKQMDLKENVKDNYEWKAVRKNNSRIWIHTYSQTITYNNQTAVLLLLIDINQRKKLEEELKNLTNDLENQVKVRTQELNQAFEDIKTKNEQLEDLKESLIKSLEKEKELNNLKNQFISMISHEYRTPLTILSTSLEIIENHLKRYYKDSLNKLDKNFRKCQFAIDKMVYLLKQVLSISKDFQNKIKVNLEQINLSEILKDLIDNSRIIYQSHEIIYNKPDHNIIIKTDRILFEQII